MCEFSLLSRSVESLWAEECENIKRYDLYHLLKLNPEEASKSSSSSEVLCSSFFEEVVKGMNVVITVKKKVPQFANLYQLYSTDQRPDLNLSREEDDLPLILVEVHSSPFAETVKKTILCVTDQLRLYRTHDAKITRCVGFTFPKQKVHQCVVMVTVTWERMGFKYILTPIDISQC